MHVFQANLEIENCISGGAKVNKEKNKKVTIGRHGVFVRLSPVQRVCLEKDAKLAGWSVPSVLRESYFKKLPIKLTFDKEGEKKFLAEFRRIGNNINQLAKASNSGDLSKFSELHSVSEQLSLLYRYVMRVDGIRKNTEK